MSWNLSKVNHVRVQEKDILPATVLIIKASILFTTDTINTHVVHMLI